MFQLTREQLSKSGFLSPSNFAFQLFIFIGFNYLKGDLCFVIAPVIISGHVICYNICIYLFSSLTVGVCVVQTFARAGVTGPIKCLACIKPVV